jgi:hypothetical protein
MIRVILAMMLAVLLTACGAGNAPDRTLVEKAIALQLSQTQQELTQQLFRGTISPVAAQISHVKIKQQRHLAIADLDGYRVRGTYDLTLDLPKQKVSQRQNRFEIYLQQQSEGKTWKLARPLAGGEDWVTQVIE